jgi:hypothetical protein
MAPVLIAKCNLSWVAERERERERERVGGWWKRGCGPKQELRRGIKEFG